MKDLKVEENFHNIVSSVNTNDYVDNIDRRLTINEQNEWLEAQRALIVLLASLTIQRLLKGDEDA